MRCSTFLTKTVEKWPFTASLHLPGFYASFYFLRIFSSPIDREYVEMIFFIFISMGSHDLKLFIVITLESFHIVSRIFKQNPLPAHIQFNEERWRERDKWIGIGKISIPL